MQFTFASNPTAPLMWAALILAALMLVLCIVLLNVIDRRYPDAEARRRLRRSGVDSRVLTAGLGLAFTVLALAIVASVGDVVTYAKNVQLVQQQVSSLGLNADAQQAKALLGNEYDYLYKPIVADDLGEVGSAQVQGQKLELMQLGGGRYALRTDNVGGGNS